MDMYQKRKIRKEKNTRELEENSTMNINWLITINLNPFERYCKIREKSK